MDNTKGSNALIDEVLERIKKLATDRNDLEYKTTDVAKLKKELSAIETVKGVSSSEYTVKNELIESVEQDIANLNKEIAELSFKKSELKPILDNVSEMFESYLRMEQEREYHIEIGPKPTENDVDEDGNIRPLTKEEITAGRKAYRKLVDYLNRDVKWTAKTAAGLMVLVRNMEENREWVRSNEFDNVIMLRSSNVLVLWRSILEDMEGKGYHDARAFIECWTNCGKGLSDAVRDIQEQHTEVRELGTKLNTIEDEYMRSEDDINDGDNEKVITTQEEVNPDF
ncbi:MAG: hypothetical protein NC548_21240 [Lachnospiraceae bacterium]|nr:hypothetical protein [Lachnospiraceae bacterium]